jgi:hypothetical protein
MRVTAMLLVAAGLMTGRSPGPTAGAAPERSTPVVPLLCPMPVARPDSTAVDPMPVDRTNTALPMPTLTPACRNPLFRPR